MPSISALVDGQIARIDGEIPAFELDLAAATAAFVQIAEIARAHGIAHPFATLSWSPATETREFISIHPYAITPALGEALQRLGLSGSDGAGYSLLVQKHAPWPRDRYARLSEAEQIAADRAWVEAGGWLSDEKLRRAGLHNG